MRLLNQPLNDEAPKPSTGTRTLVRAGILLRLLVATGSSFCGGVLDRFDFLTIDSSISGSASESTMMMGAPLRYFEVELKVEGVGLEVEGTGFMLEGVNFKLQKVSFGVCGTGFELEEAGSAIRFFEEVDSATVSAARRRFFCFFSLVSYNPISHQHHINTHEQARGLTGSTASRSSMDRFFCFLVAASTASLSSMERFFCTFAVAS